MYLGDIVLEVDGHLIRTEKAIPVILQDRIGRIILAMIAVDSVTAAESGRLKHQNSGRLRQARDLFAKVSTHLLSLLELFPQNKSGVSRVYFFLFLHCVLVYIFTFIVMPSLLAFLLCTLCTILIIIIVIIIIIWTIKIRVFAF